MALHDKPVARGEKIALQDECVRQNRAMTAKRRQPAPAVHEEQAAYQVADAGLSSGRFKFIDLFCGIGGFRLAFEKAGGKCVFSSDWDKFSQITYAANFGDRPHGDIHTVAVADIPAHDVLCGGFPCQPFSLAGVSKKNSLGRKHGFEDVIKPSFDQTAQ